MVFSVTEKGVAMRHETISDDKEFVEVEEEVIEEAGISKEGSCTLLSHVGATAALQGVSCQQVFTNAFMRAGIHESKARAFFVRFLESDRTVIPDEITAYGKRIKKVTQVKGCQTGFCMGCTMTEESFGGASLAYRFIHPEVFAETDGREKKVAEPQRQVSEADELFLDLLESGVLSNDERWEELAQSDDFAVDELEKEP